MVEASEINWGSYRNYEGPFFIGFCKPIWTGMPTDNEKILEVITATEGGHYDAYNGYDGQVCSSGLIQYIERGQYSVSAMLGDVADAERNCLHMVDQVAAESGLCFKKNASGKWRFFFLDSRGEVDTYPKQQAQFFLHATGEKGSWDSESKAYAKKWAAAISDVWEVPFTQRVQEAFIIPRLQTFVFGPAAVALFHAAPSNDFGKAFQAAYLSFAANNPLRASQHLVIANNTSKKTPYSLDWLVDVLKELTFGPQITIYPARYNAIRPVLDRLYNINLPDFADDLKQWQYDQPHNFFYDVKEIQQALITLGYDLGPTGADGVPGTKTRAAVLDFEQHDYNTKAVVPPEFQDGTVDQYTAAKLEEVLEQRGYDILKGG